MLESIVAEMAGDDRQSTVYVGDSLMKDVAMAQMIGVVDVYAEYGIAQQRHEYELLRRVSHWTPADVERERAISSQPHVKPTYTLEHSFAELLGLFTFAAP